MDTIDLFENQLSAALPKDTLLSASNTIELHSFSIEGQVPLLAILPRTAEEISTALRIAHEHGVSITPSGANTLQSMGALPVAPLIVLSLSRMRRLLIHEPADLTCSAEAGLPLGALNDQIGEHNQMLPIDAPFPERATLGGLIATNTCGPRKQGYGSFRDCIIGIRVVHADGMISKSGGMVVKNVSGYDMAKLYTGSLGTLGVIVSANFKLWPVPQAQRTCLAHFESLQNAMDLSARLFESQHRPAAAVLLSPGASNRIELNPKTHTLAIRCEGPPALLSRMERDIGAWAAPLKPLHFSALGTEDTQSFWMRAESASQTAELGDEEAVIKIASLPTRLLEIINSIENECNTFFMQSEFIAYSGLGIVIARIAARPPMPITFAHALCSAQERWISQFGNAVVLGCKPQWKRGLPLWGALPSGFPLMQSLKHHHDEKNILNRGRYVGGL